MQFEIVAMTAAPNAFGLTGVRLFNERAGLVEAWKYKPAFAIGDTVTIRPGRCISYWGLDWASEGFEAAIPVRPRVPHVEPEHVPTHYLCIHMFRALDDGRESLSLLRIEAARRDEIPEVVNNRASLFHTKFDRYEIKDLGLI